MNFLAHALPAWTRTSIEVPWAVVGTSLPDWMRSIDRNVRLRPHHAAAHVDTKQDALRFVCWGVVRHHDDDVRFHAEPGFEEANARITADMRVVSPPEVRASVLGHVLAEMLLDRVLMQRYPTLVGDYYRALDELNANAVQTVVQSLLAVPLPTAATAFRRFRDARFLRDYETDRGMWNCLEGVCVRAGLVPPPSSLRSKLSSWTDLVARVSPDWIDDEDRYPSGALASARSVE
jgi:hypothetical protein